MDTSYNFTGLTSNTNYNVTVTSSISTCLGIPTTITITISTREAGVAGSELILLCICNMKWWWKVFPNIVYMESIICQIM